MSAGDGAEPLDIAFRRALGLEGETDVEQASVRRADVGARLVEAAERAMREHRNELAVLFCLAAARDAETLEPRLESVLAAAFETVRCLGVAPDAHPGGAHCVAWSPDGGMLASGGADGEVILWSAADRLVRAASLDGHADRVRRVEFNRVEPFIATCGDDGAAIVWDLATQAAAWRVQGKDASALAARFGPCGRKLAVAAAPEWSGLHDARTGEVLFPFSRHDGVVIYDAVFSPDGTKVATCGDDGRAFIWDVATGEVDCTITHERPVRSVAFDATGERVATASYDGGVLVTRLSDGEAVRLESPRGRAYDAQFLAGGASLWIIGEGGAHAVAPLGADPGADPGVGVQALEPHAGQILAARVSRDGERFASAGRDGATRVFAVTPRGAERIAVFRSAGAATWDAAAAWGAGRAATADADGSVRIWLLPDESPGRLRPLSGRALLDAAKRWRRASGRAPMRAELQLLVLDAGLSVLG